MLRVWVIRVQRGPVSDVWNSCYLIPPFWLLCMLIRPAVVVAAICREPAGFGPVRTGLDRFGPVEPVVPVVPVGPVDVGVRIFVLLFLAPKWVDIISEPRCRLWQV